MVLLSVRSIWLVWALSWPVTMVSGAHSTGRKKHKDVYLGENSKNKYGGRIDFKLKKQDSTKSLLIKTEQLLRIEEHDFAIRPGFGSLLEQMEQ